MKLLELFVQPLFDGWLHKQMAIVQVSDDELFARVSRCVETEYVFFDRDVAEAPTQRASAPEDPTGYDKISANHEET